MPFITAMFLGQPCLVVNNLSHSAEYVHQPQGRIQGPVALTVLAGRIR